MIKHLYLITFIALFLANSHISLANETEAREVCGKLLSSLLVIEVNKAAALENPMLVEEEFCDAGQNELNANFEITFFDAHKKALYTKRVYLNPDIFVESYNFEKDKFTATEIHKGSNSRILKVPIVKNILMYDSYIIKSLNENKTTDIKKIILGIKK